MEEPQLSSFRILIRQTLIKVSEKIFDFAYYLLSLGAGRETMEKVEKVEAEEAAAAPDDSQLWLIMGLQSGTLTFYGFAGDDKELHSFKYKKVSGRIMFCKNLIELRHEIITNFASATLK